MTEHLDKIDNDIAEMHLLKHPFYLAWARGEQSKEALSDYAALSAPKLRHGEFRHSANFALQ